MIVPLKLIAGVGWKRNRSLGRTPHLFRNSQPFVDEGMNPVSTIQAVCGDGTNNFCIYYLLFTFFSNLFLFVC